MSNVVILSDRLHPRHTRPLPKPAAQPAREAPALTANTPHRRFADAIRRLGDTGHEHTADMAHRLFARACQFPLPDGRPHPEYVALALKELLGVPSELAAPYRHASAAARAVFEIAFPEFHTEPTKEPA